jgi:MFS family permease
MVEKFGYRVESIATLFLFNCVLNLYIAPLIGRLVHKWGEKRALMFEYVGLIIVFVCYAFVESPVLAAILYLVDHALFAMAIAMKTYFQKIADPADFAPTAGVAFTINHIAAVIIPVIFGFIWLKNPETVFLAGAGIACLSLLLASVVPKSPRAGNEVAFSKVWSAISARD